MAGSGKTTLVQRLASHLYANKTPTYLINLDPAATRVPYPANIDIRDTVNYKNVMKQYGLGPNGGILTSCNLFATRFDQVRCLALLLVVGPLLQRSLISICAAHALWYFKSIQVNFNFTFYACICWFDVAYSAYKGSGQLTQQLT